MTKCNHTEGPGHDCAYVDWRDSLIPIAEATADAEVGDGPTERWDAVFHRMMARLTNESGVMQ